MRHRVCFEIRSLNRKHLGLRQCQDTLQRMSHFTCGTYLRGVSNCPKEIAVLMPRWPGAHPTSVACCLATTGVFWADLFDVDRYRNAAKKLELQTVIQFLRRCEEDWSRRLCYSRLAFVSTASCRIAVDRVIICDE